MNSHTLRVLRGQLPREILVLLLFASLMLQSATAVTPPGWWTTRGVLAPGATADDYAVANLGQLKAIAKKAAQEMNAVLPGGAGSSINDMITSWSNAPASGVTRDDYAALTLGQLKAVATPFYDRLAAVDPGTITSYPWTGMNLDDYALANLGQLKTVFAFDVVDPDSNHNTIPDSWEMEMFGDLNQSITGDFDGDGVNNRDEFLAGTNAKAKDTDGDGIDDQQEKEDGTDPKNAGSVDSDRDGVLDAEDAVPYDPNFTHPKSGMPNYVVMDLGLCEGGFIDMADNGTLLWREIGANEFGISMLKLWSPTMTAALDVPWNYITSGPEDSEGYAGLTAVTSEGLIIGGSRQIIPTQAGTPIYETRHFTLNPRTDTIAWMPRSYPTEEGTYSRLYWEYLGDPQIGPDDKFFGSSIYQFWPTTTSEYSYFKVTQFRHGATTAAYEKNVFYWEDTPDLPTTPPGSSGYPGMSSLIGTEYKNDYNHYVKASGAGAVVITERSKNNVYKVAQYDFWPDSWDMGYWTYGVDWDAAGWPLAHAVYLENIRTCTLLTATQSYVLESADTVTETTSKFVYFGGVSPEPEPWVSYNEDNYLKNAWTYLNTKSYLYKPDDAGTEYERAAIYAKKADYPDKPIDSIGLVAPQKRALVWGKYDPDTPDDGVQAIWADGEAQPISKLINGYDDYTEWSIEDVSQEGMLAATAKRNSDNKYHMLILSPVELLDTKDKVFDDQAPTTPEEIRDVIIRPKKNSAEKDPQSTAWIEPHGSETVLDAPDMPQLALRFHGTEQMGLKIKWKLEVIYDRPRGNLPDEQAIKAQDEVFVPTKSNGTQPWREEALSANAVRFFNDADWAAELQGKGFFGGDAKLTYQLLKSNGDEMGNEKVVLFDIGGKNPIPAKCKAYIDTNATSAHGNMWFAYAMAKSESSNFNPERRYNQFWERTGSYAKRPHRRGEPTWAKATWEESAGGFGLFQVTGRVENTPSGLNGKFFNIPRRQIWDWQAHVLAGLTIVRHKQDEAYDGTWDYMNGTMAHKKLAGQLRGQRLQAKKANNGNDVPVPDEVVGRVTFKDGTERPIESAVTIKAYNGAARHYVGWNNKTKKWEFFRTNGKFNYVARVCEEVE